MLGNGVAAEISQQLLSSSHALGAGGPGGSYSLPPCYYSQIHTIPGNELDKVEAESNANPSFEDGRVGVIVKVAGDNLAFSVAWDAFTRLSEA